jgi:hypothetical protein
MQPFYCSRKQHTIRSLTICSISAKSADVAPSSALRERLDDCKHKPIFRQCLWHTGHPQHMMVDLHYFYCIKTKYYTQQWDAPQNCSDEYKYWFHTLLWENHKTVKMITFPVIIIKHIKQLSIFRFSSHFINTVLQEGVTMQIKGCRLRSMNNQHEFPSYKLVSNVQSSHFNHHVTKLRMEEKCSD